MRFIIRKKGRSLMGKIVVKIGGVASENLTKNFFAQIKNWQSKNHEVIIVHGGGHYISDMMERLQLPVLIKEGLRVTNDQTLKVTQMVLIGQVQPTITTIFQQSGFAAVGLNAACGHLIHGKFIDKKKWGYVGKIVKINPQVIDDTLMKKYIPVIAPLGLTEDGQWLNVNADETACKIAETLQADHLYLLTDVPGIKSKGNWLKEVTTNELNRISRSAMITGGMIPKVNSALSALENGVKQVHITNQLENSGTIIKKEEVYA